MAGVDKNTTVVIDMGANQIINTIKGFDRTFVLIGIFKDAGHYPPEISRLTGSRPARKPPHVAQVGFWHEFGTRFIPARPWMRRAILSNLPAVTAKGKELEQKVINLELTVTEGLELLGDFILQLQKRSLVTAQSWAEPLSPRTVREKRRRGSITPSRPLSNTLKMLQSLKRKAVVK